MTGTVGQWGGGEVGWWGGVATMAENKRKSKGTSHMAVGGKTCAGELPFINPSEFKRLMQYHKNSTGKDLPPGFSYLLQCPSHEEFKMKVR